MSKKIAQLTKVGTQKYDSIGGATSAPPIPMLKVQCSNANKAQVIYHLNNRNEDHDVDLQEMAEQYETEIEQILKDTADKVNFFKDLMEQARDEKQLQQIHQVPSHMS